MPDRPIRSACSALALGEESEEIELRHVYRMVGMLKDELARLKAQLQQ